MLPDSEAYTILFGMPFLLFISIIVPCCSKNILVISLFVFFCLFFSKIKNNDGNAVLHLFHLLRFLNSENSSQGLMLIVFFIDDDDDDARRINTGF
jgi:hypothetical protein